MEFYQDVNDTIRRVQRQLILIQALVCAWAFAASPVAATSKDVDVADATHSCRIQLMPGDDLQRAIDLASVDAGNSTNICLGPGRFRLHRLLSIKRSHLHLVGRGAKTHVQLDPGLNSPAIVIGDFEHATPQAEVTDISVENMRIEGSGRSSLEYDPAYPYLMNSVVAVRAGNRITLRNLQVNRCRSACLLTERDSHDVVIEGNAAAHSEFDGLSLNDTRAARVLDNHFLGNHAAGITAEHLDDSIMSNNVMLDNGSDGIYLSNSRNNTVTGNEFVNNDLAGVFLTCAVIQHSSPPGCSTTTMSVDNSFTGNRFVNNRYAFFIEPDRTAHRPDTEGGPNRSCGDTFVNNPNKDDDPVAPGRYITFANPK